ncbi:MAG: HAD family hydrolase, partial [Caldimicrobium sp.]
IFPKELKSFFEVFITGDKIEKRKPHPDPYLKAIKFFNVPNDKCLAVENSPAGIKSAKGANLLCIALTTTLAPEYLSSADYIVHSHKDLRNLLLNEKTK